MRGLTLEEASPSDLADKLAVANRNLAADRDDGWAAFDLPAFEGVVVDVLRLVFDGEFAQVIRVLNDKVGIRSGLDHALARIEVENLGRVGAGHRDELLEA